MFKIESVSVFRAPKAGGAGEVDVIGFEGGGLMFCRDLITASDVRMAKRVAEKYKAQFVVAPQVLHKVNVALCGGELSEVVSRIDVKSMDSYKLCAASGGIGMAEAVIGGVPVHCLVREKQEVRQVKSLQSMMEVNFTEFSTAP